MSDEVQCEGLGLGLTVNHDGEFVAFIMLGEEERHPTHAIRLPLEKLNAVITTLMSIANEIAFLQDEADLIPDEGKAKHLSDVCDRYAAGSN